MKQLIYVLFQIDEARKYIQSGKMEQLRLALILLDNAAEMQMHKSVQDIFRKDKIIKSIIDTAGEIPESKRSKGLQELVDRSSVSEKMKKKINRFFPEKVSYLSDEYDYLDPGIADVLCYIHKYRNETYHNIKVRPETIETASKILFDINCEMLLSLPVGTIKYGSESNYSWLEERFGLESSMGHDEIIRKAINDMKLRISLSDNMISSTLTNHIESRISDLLNNLDFISNSSNDPNSDRESALRSSQYYFATESIKADPPDVHLNQYKAEYSMEDVEQIKHQISDINQSSSKFDAFKVFAKLESELERIEEPVISFTFAIDEWINLQVDMLRGK